MEQELALPVDAVLVGEVQVLDVLLYQALVLEAPVEFVAELGEQAGYCVAACRADEELERVVLSGDADSHHDLFLFNLGLAVVPGLRRIGRGRFCEFSDELDVVALYYGHAHLERLFGPQAFRQRVDLRVVLLELRYHLSEHGDVDVLVRVEGGADHIGLSPAHYDGVEIALGVLEGQRGVDERAGAY